MVATKGASLRPLGRFRFAIGPGCGPRNARRTGLRLTPRKAAILRMLKP